MFLEALIKLLFLCDSEKYIEIVLGIFFKEYPKYSYIYHKSGPKPRFPESAPSNLTDLSRKTLFIFKGDSGRPRTFIPAKITSISLHQHIKTTTNGYCLICRNSNEIKNRRIVQRENIVYGTIFQVFGETLEEIKSSSKDSKKIRGRQTVWKCSECAVPICRPGEPCWNIAHRRLFNK